MGTILHIANSTFSGMLLPYAGKLPITFRLNDYI